MKLSPAAHAKLRELLDIYVTQRTNPAQGSESGTAFLVTGSFGQNEGLNNVINMGGIRSIGLSFECLDLLGQEDGLLYLNHDQLHDAVTSLVVTIHTDDTRKFKNPKYTTTLIKNFSQEYLKEERRFDIAFVISGPLTIDSSPLSVGEGVLSKWTDDQALEWGIIDEARPDFVNQPVLVVSARGVTDEVALARARVFMEECLAVLGACIGYSGEIKTLLARQNPSIQIPASHHNSLPDIYEQHLQFRAQGKFAVKEQGVDAPATLYRSQDPVIADLSLDGQLHTLVTSALFYFNKFYSRTDEGRYPREGRRALEWIGSSITRPRYDDRVVDLCTALECVLSNSSDKKKAEALTIRQMVLSQYLGYAPYFEVPHILYNLYLMRNDIVHGSDTRICNQNHAFSLMRLSLSVMVAIAQISEANKKGFPNASKLVQHLDSQNGLIIKARSYLTCEFIPEDKRPSYLAKFSKESQDIHSELVKYIDKYLLPSTSNEDESKVTH